MTKSQLGPKRKASGDIALLSLQRGKALQVFYTFSKHKRRFQTRAAITCKLLQNERKKEKKKRKKKKATCLCHSHSGHGYVTQRDKIKHGSVTAQVVFSRRNVFSGLMDRIPSSSVTRWLLIRVQQHKTTLVTGRHCCPCCCRCCCCWRRGSFKTLRRRSPAHFIK